MQHTRCLMGQHVGFRQGCRSSSGAQQRPAQGLGDSMANAQLHQACAATLTPFHRKCLFVWCLGKIQGVVHVINQAM